MLQKNHVPDIMHDVLEGICAYDLPLIIKALIDSRVVTLPLINHKLQTFDYNYDDASNRIPVITSLDAEMLTFDACQLWSATRVLSLAIGDKVPEKCDVWRVYLLLRDLLDLILTPKLSERQLKQLGAIISEYLLMRVSLFPHMTLKKQA